MIPISNPWLTDHEKRAVTQVLDSGMLAQGPRVVVERAFAEYIGVKHAVATSSGTAALHVALLADNIGPGDEVITTPFTFIASVNSILYTGATPSLVDIGSDFNLDVTQVEAAITPHTKAIMPVHLFGQPCDMDALTEIARAHNLILIEDACQAHGASFRSKRVGSFSTGGFSFYATKNMTTGEGGMLTTNDDAIVAHARLLINHGMRVRYQHEELGYNYRMTDLAAAIGIEQARNSWMPVMLVVSRMPHFMMSVYPISRGVELPQLAPHRSHVYHQYTIRLTPASFPLSREQFIAALSSRGIGSGIYYPEPVHRQSSVASKAWAQVDLPRSETDAAQVVSLPVHPLVTAADRTYIVDTIQSLLTG